MSNGSIPNDLIEAIADSTAISVGEQPAILSNLALANLIANTNLAQQNAISNQQAMFQLEMTIVSKCVEVIANINPSNSQATQQLAAMQQIMDTLKHMQTANAVSSATANKAAADVEKPGGRAGGARKGSTGTKKPKPRNR
jgi:hypothetical protein